MLFYNCKYYKGNDSRGESNFATSCKVFERVSCNDLRDEADIQAKLRLTCANSYTLHQTFIFRLSAIEITMLRQNLVT